MPARTRERSRMLTGQWRSAVGCIACAESRPARAASARRTAKDRAICTDLADAFAAARGTTIALPQRMKTLRRRPFLAKGYGPFLFAVLLVLSVVGSAWAQTPPPPPPA